MADTTSPKKYDIIKAADISPLEGSGLYRTLNKDACDMIFACEVQAISDNSWERLVKVTLYTF